MLKRTRVLGLAVLVAGLCAVAILAQAGGATSSNLPASAGAVSTSIVPPLMGSLMKASSVTAGMNWVDGATNENATFIYEPCIGCVMEGYDAAFTSYYTYTNSSGTPTGVFPQAGDIYYMAVVLDVIGNPGSGGEAANDEIQLPSNTSLAIDSSHPTYCYFYNSSGAVISRPTCPSPTVGGALPISLGGAPIASYDTFEEDFPVKDHGASERPLQPDLAERHDVPGGQFDQPGLLAQLQRLGDRGVQFYDERVRLRGHLGPGLDAGYDDQLGAGFQHDRDFGQLHLQLEHERRHLRMRARLGLVGGMRLAQGLLRALGR